MPEAANRIDRNPRGNQRPSYQQMMGHLKVLMPICPFAELRSYCRIGGCWWYCQLLKWGPCVLSRVSHQPSNIIGHQNGANATIHPVGDLGISQAVHGKCVLLQNSSRENVKSHRPPKKKTPQGQKAVSDFAESAANPFLMLNATTPSHGISHKTNRSIQRGSPF